MYIPPQAWILLALRAQNKMEKKYGWFPFARGPYIFSLSFYARKDSTCS